MDIGIIFLITTIIWLMIIYFLHNCNYHEHKHENNLSNSDVYDLTNNPLEILKHYVFSEKTLKSFSEKYPHFTPEQNKLVQNTLKDFFILNILEPKKNIAMPSRVVDELWHSMIDDKEEYADFCQKIFKKELNHIEEPNSIKGKSRNNPVRGFTKDVKQTYKLFSYHNDIQFNYASNKIPMLFMIDTLFPIDFGYFYDDLSLEILKHPYALTNYDLNTEKASDKILSHLAKKHNHPSFNNDQISKNGANNTQLSNNFSIDNIVTTLVIADILDSTQNSNTSNNESSTDCSNSSEPDSSCTADPTTSDSNDSSSCSSSSCSSSSCSSSSCSSSSCSS